MVTKFQEKVYREVKKILKTTSFINGLLLET